MAAVRAHLARGDLHDGLVFDAVRVRLIEIGEAVKALPAELLASEPTLPWAQIAGMRDRLAHRYFDTSHAILAATVSDDLPELDTAVRRLLRAVDEDT
ncbi:MAG: HepT-like ribonuclease domain-containing protein [Acidimicrobiales bacterium]